MRKQWKQWQTLSSWAAKSLQMVNAATKLKAMTNLDSILKSRDITLSTNVYIVKAIVFPIVMYGYKNWTIKKVEHWRTDTFELWYWRRILWVPWTARRSNQSILRENSSECWKDWCWGWKSNTLATWCKELTHWKYWCWSWSSNTLATWCEELIHWKRCWCWEWLRTGAEGGNREWVGWMAS